MADAARATLRAAVASARAGDRQRARELCAAVVFESQPLIAARADLLRAAFHALLVARGFKLLSRLALAISGRGIQLIELSDRAGPVAPPRRREEAGCAIYTLDPRWLDRLSPNDMFLRLWCDTLVAQRHTIAAPVAAAPVPRRLAEV